MEKLAEELRELRYRCSDSGRADAAFVLDNLIELVNRIEQASTFASIEEALVYVLERSSDGLGQP